MRKKNVLVTAVSGDVGNSILKCLQPEVAPEVGQIYGCDIYRYPCGMNKVERCFQVPPCKEEEPYLRALLNIAEKYHIDVIVPSNEQEIAVLSRRRDVIEAQGIRLLLHDAAVYDAFFDKKKTQELLQSLGLPFLPTWRAAEYQEQGTFPLVLKDAFSCGSKSLRIAHDEAELARWVDRKGDQIIQRCVGTPDSEYTVPVFSGDGGRHVVALPLRRILSKAGYTSFIELARPEYQEKIFAICTKIAAHIKLRGSIDLQMREENGVFYVFECNPRLSGTVNFRRQLGFEDARWWLQSLSQEDLTILFQLPEQSFVGIRELNEEIVWRNEHDDTV